MARKAHVPTPAFIMCAWTCTDGVCRVARVDAAFTRRAERALCRPSRDQTQSPRHARASLLYLQVLRSIVVGVLDVKMC